jgi:phosphoribosylanthranilate isomerase
LALKLPRLGLVTITGADDSVDPYLLIHLSRFYPFVEWGVLSSEKRRGTARYPSFAWLKEFEKLASERLSVNTSLHLCGAEARRAIAMAREFCPHMPWKRVQLNGYQPGAIRECRRPRTEFSFIFQARSPDTLGEVIRDARDADAHLLFDPSGGAGKSPESWPASFGDGTGVFVGFAGGIGPSNVSSTLETLAEMNRGLPLFWVDMESGVRKSGNYEMEFEKTNGFKDTSRFDIDKVRDVLEAAREFREKQHAIPEK